jgi:hypothetical protein
MGSNGIRFSAKYLSAALGGPLEDLDGKVINGSTGPGFPGFNPSV